MFRNDNYILVCFGGSDFGNLIEWVVDVLIELKFLIFLVDIVVGVVYFGVSVFKVKVECLFNVKFYVVCGYIFEFMKVVNIMIGVGGLMYWECVVLGVVGIIIILVDN